MDIGYLIAIIDWPNHWLAFGFVSVSVFFYSSFFSTILFHYYRSDLNTYSYNHGDICNALVYRAQSRAQMKLIIISIIEDIEQMDAWIDEWMDGWIEKKGQLLNCSMNDEYSPLVSSRHSITFTMKWHDVWDMLIKTERREEFTFRKIIIFKLVKWMKQKIKRE